MKLLVETVRVSQKSKDQLVRIKRNTGIENWNSLCRCALLHSLSLPEEPDIIKLESISSIEMTWKTFAGDHGKVIEALIAYRYKKSKTAYISDYFYAHLQRGIEELAKFDSETSLPVESSEIEICSMFRDLTAST